MEHIFSCFQKRFKIGGIFFRIDLRGGSGSAFGHFSIELFKGDGLPQVIVIIFSIQLVVEAYVGNLS